MEDYLDFETLPNGTQFVENGKRYTVIGNNMSNFMRVILPTDSAVLVYRHYDSGLTFRGGSVSKKDIVE